MFWRRRLPEKYKQEVRNSVGVGAATKSQTARILKVHVQKGSTYEAYHEMKPNVQSSIQRHSRAYKWPHLQRKRKARCLTMTISSVLKKVQLDKKSLIVIVMETIY